MCFQLTQALQLMSSVNNPPHSAASNYGSLPRDLLDSLEAPADPLVHPDTVGLPLVVLEDSSGPHRQVQVLGGHLEAAHMGL